METNSFLSASPTGKLAAFVVAVLMAFSSFTLLASGDYEEQASVASQAAILTAGDIDALDVTDAAPLGIVPDDMLPQPVIVQAGKFSPVRADPGDAKILVMDDDAEFWMSGPWLEASHIETALNDGRYSFDVFRAGFWEQVDRGLPSGDEGLDIVDDYEAIIWYGGWNGRAYVNAQEQSIMMNYLDGDCVSEADGGNGFCTTNRNVIHVTQMGDWFHAYGGAGYRGGYIHYDTRGGLIVDGTSNPLKGVDDSIFDGKEYNTDELGVHYLDRPVGAGTASTGPAMGAFWYDALSTTTAPYHAIQFPRTDVPPTTDPSYKSLYFGTEIGCIGGREDRADLFTTILDWMDVDPEAKKNVDVGIGGLHIPNHSQYWRTVEAMVPVQIEATLTNYGNLEQSHTGAHLQLKNQFGQILFDNTFDTRAFANELTGYDTDGDGQFDDPHPMSITSLAPHGLAGDSVMFTFNRTNDALQLAHEEKNPNKARDVLFTSAGMDFLSVRVVHVGDQVPSNDYIQASVGVSKWVDNGEPTCGPNQQTRWYDRCESGASLTFGDTGDNGASSLDYVNYHRGHSYDFDADGCGWARPMTHSDCAGGAGTANESLGISEMEGLYALDGYRANGWYKSNANTADNNGDGYPDACSWTETDNDCPKFTPEPWQDDYFMSPALDFSAMEEVILGMVFSGCMESGDYFRMQISKDNGATWTSLISYTNFCPGKGAWYLWGGGNARYQGYVLASTYYGKEDTDNIRFRVQQDNDGDEVTEAGGRIRLGWFVDEIVFRGTEKITRDLAMTDVTVREEGFIVKSKTDDLHREINATVLNAGEASWTDLPVIFSATNLQGEDLTGLLDDSEKTIATLAGDASFGNIDAEGHEDQKDLFLLFSATGPNTYFVTAEVLALRADFFPWNNSMTVSFRIFDTFFYDPVDQQPGKDPIEYTEFESTSMVDNFWNSVTANSAGVGSSDAGNDGTRIYSYYDGGDGYSGGADSHMVTPDACSRNIGGQSVSDVCIDLRAAYEPKLQFYIMWDLQPGDRFEVRAATNFDSLQQSSGTWTVLKEYSCSVVETGCSSGTWNSGGWVEEIIEMDAFNGYQTWIDFRVVTVTGTNGGSGGILLDDIAVIGNEYRYNLAITDVDTTHFGAAGKEHDLSIEVKNVGLKDQDDVVVSAQITDVNGMRVWPAATPYTEYIIQDTTLSKGDTFTVDPESSGDAWKWGLGLDPGIYTLRVVVRNADPLAHPDENWDDNLRNITLVLGATLLSGDAWSGDWSGGDGTWSWSGSASGDLNSDSFDVWNSKPFLVVESSFDLTNSYVQAQVRVGSQWYDVKWRDATLEGSSLYAIPGNNYTELPDSWTGSSQFEGQGKHAFYADLGVVDEISDGTSLQEQYVRASMEIRLRGVSNDGSGSFKVFNPSVFGLNRYDVDVTGITPTSQKAEPSSQLIPSERTYTVKVRNLGAVTDSGVVDFAITVPDNSLVALDSDGLDVVKVDRILQRDGGTVVAIKPTGGNWQDPNRYALGDQTAYIDENGEITWPSTSDTGYTEFTAATGWKIDNPTKDSWNSNLDKPQAPTAGSMKDPGETLNVNVEITVGFASWAPPGTYTIQADARSWTDYGNTFTEGDVEGQATMTIDPPDLRLGESSWITHAIGMSQGSGWSKTSGGEAFFSFEVEVLNTGTETVGTFKVGLLYLDLNPVGVDVGLFWTGSEWDIDADETTATGAELRERSGRQFVYFRATASQLGMSAGPGDDIAGTYVFYLAVDTEEDIAESNENNNRRSIEITAVAEINTIPSFALAPLSMLASSLLAALAIALRREEEE